MPRKPTTKHQLNEVNDITCSVSNEMFDDIDMYNLHVKRHNVREGIRVVGGGNAGHRLGFVRHGGLGGLLILGLLLGAGAVGLRALGRCEVLPRRCAILVVCEGSDRPTERQGWSDEGADAGSGVSQLGFIL